MEVVILVWVVDFIVLLVFALFCFKEAFILIRDLWRKFVHFLLDDPS